MKDLSPKSQSRHKRSDIELVQVSEHLWYEVQMLYHVLKCLLTYDLVQNPEWGTPVRFALLESFGIHARNLIFFFFDDKPRENDAVAVDFVDDPTQWLNARGDLPDILKSVPDKVGKMIAHLTYNRVLFTSAQREWNLGDIADALDPILTKFAEHVPETRLTPALRTFLLNPDRFRGPTLHAAGVSTTTTSVTTLVRGFEPRNIVSPESNPDSD